MDRLALAFCASGLFDAIFVNDADL
jgi:hypothetical protein